MEDKIKIVSDGTDYGTKILLGDKTLRYVQALEFKLDVNKHKAGILNLTIVLPDVSVELLKEQVHFKFINYEGLDVQKILDDYLISLLADNSDERYNPNFSD